MTPHEHAFERTHIPRAPTPDGGHTTFYLLFCRCGHAEVFPLGNYHLTTAAFQQSFAGRCAVEGLTLDLTPPEGSLTGVGPDYVIVDDPDAGDERTRVADHEVHALVYLFDADRQPVAVDMLDMDEAESAELPARMQDRHVADAFVHGCRVSTVLLPTPDMMSMLRGTPRPTFETRIFGGPLDNASAEYASVEEARRGHTALLAVVQACFETPRRTKKALRKWAADHPVGRRERPRVAPWLRGLRRAGLDVRDARLPTMTKDQREAFARLYTGLA